MNLGGQLEFIFLSNSCKSCKNVFLAFICHTWEKRDWGHLFELPFWKVAPALNRREPTLWSKKTWTQENEMDFSAATHEYVRVLIIIEFNLEN